MMGVKGEHSDLQFSNESTSDIPGAEMYCLLSHVGGDLVVGDS